MSLNIPNFQTPFFIFDEKSMLGELGKLKTAISSYWPNTIVAYSVKTNSLPYLAKYLKSQGLYAEVVSQDEFEMVSLCGYEAKDIVCNGPIKSSNFIERLMAEHAIFNIDSHVELEHAINYAKNNSNDRFGVGLRVNIDIEKEFPSESKAGLAGSRFGFCIDNDELEKAILCLGQCDNIYVRGLHLHVSTTTRKVEIYEWLSEIFADLCRRYKLDNIEYFDIGGGFFGGMPDKPGWNDYICSISKALVRNGIDYKKVALILEPGVSLLAGAFSYYVKVVDVKQTNRSRFVVTDGSRIHIDPFFHKTSYFYEYFPLKDGVELPIMENQILVGFTCLEYDDIMTLKNSTEIERGDIFRFDKIGAYTISLSPLFITYFPAVYAKLEDGSYMCVRKKWAANEFVQMSDI